MSSAPSKKQQAADLLRKALADGQWHRACPLLDELACQGIYEWTATDACKLAGVEKRMARGKFPAAVEWRLRPANADDALVVCRLCADPLAPQRVLYCGARCRLEAHRMALILLGDERPGCPSLAHRLRAAGRRRKEVTAISRLLTAARFERRHDEGGKR